MRQRGALPCDMRAWATPPSRYFEDSMEFHRVPPGSVRILSRHHGHAHSGRVHKRDSGQEGETTSSASEGLEVGPLKRPRPQVDAHVAIAARLFVFPFGVSEHASRVHGGRDANGNLSAVNWKRCTLNYNSHEWMNKPGRGVSQKLGGQPVRPRQEAERSSDCPTQCFQL